MGEQTLLRRGIGRVAPPFAPRALAKVPFVELADGQLRGVVSSGSDLSRVYVSSIEAGTHEYTCGTNNNRPCGGLNSGGMCNHLHVLVEAAAAQYGSRRVARFLGLDGEPDTPDEIVDALRGQRGRQPAAAVFSGFLRHLGYLELPDVVEPVAELDWFPAERVAF